MLHNCRVAASVGELARVDATLLGIDVGTTNTKVVLLGVEGGGEVVELAARVLPTGDDASVLLAALEAAVAAVLAATGTRPGAIGIASMAETGLPIDPAGRPLTALQRWNAASQADADALRTVLDPEARFALTGAPLTPKATLVTLVRLRRERPALLAAPNRWAGVADLVALALTGRLATDHTLALRTMAYRLPAATAALPTGFDAELLAVAAVDPALLPEVVAPGEAVGAVTAAASARTGLVAGTPVFVAGHDHLVGTWAAGVRGPGRAADSLGTTEALVRFPGLPVDRAAAQGTGSSIVRSVDGAQEGLLSASTGAGALVGGWLARTAPGDPSPRFAEVAELLPDLGDLVVLPYPAGRQAPHPDAAAAVRLVDADGRDTDPAHCSPVELAQAALVGLALQARWLDDVQRSLTREPPQPLVVLGAGVANHAWMGIKAAVSAAPLELVTVGEPVAAGAALAAGVRAGLVPADLTLPKRPGPDVPAPSDLAPRLRAFRVAAVGAPDLGRTA